MLRITLFMLGIFILAMCFIGLSVAYYTDMPDMNDPFFWSFVVVGFLVIFFTGIQGIYNSRTTSVETSSIDDTLKTFKCEIIEKGKLNGDIYITWYCLGSFDAPKWTFVEQFTNRESLIEFFSSPEGHESVNRQAGILFPNWDSERGKWRDRD
jgi:hypothetical protein